MEDDINGYVVVIDQTVACVILTVDGVINTFRTLINGDFISTSSGETLTVENFVMRLLESPEAISIVEESLLPPGSDQEDTLVQIAIVPILGLAEDESCE